MLSRIKQYIWVALAAGVFYFLLTHHILFFSINDFELLKKVEPTLEYTFFSLKKSYPTTILRIDPLRDAGIEEVMLERGMVTEKKLDKILDRIDKAKEAEAEAEEASPKK